jgi:acyl carrier protein
MTSTEIQALVLRAMANVNLARRPDAQLSLEPDAPIFGEGSPLDSFGLVSLLIDIEEALQDRGVNASVSDARAMSRTRSPFRSVQTLVTYIQESVQPTP